MNMSIEKIILAAVWVLSVFALLTGVPKDRRREAALVFVTGQTLTWSLSLLFVEWEWVQNPVREFQKATAANFTFNFVLYPTVTVFYSLYYPKHGSAWARVGYTALYLAAFMVFLSVLQQYTDLMRQVPLYRYVGSVLVFLGVMAGVHAYKNWFFNASTSRERREGV